MATCPSCANEIQDGNRFCGACGSPIETATSAPTETSLKSQPAATSHPSLDKARFIPGTVLAKRYRIISLVGRGGMGEVYRADDLKLGQPVALKFLPREVQRDRSRLERFLNEVKVALKVTHPNVCRVYDIGEVDGQHYISMEYVDGEDLASLLRRIGHLPQDKAVQIARQLCTGLAAAHEEGILHRDLKPANVMIDGRGRAKITDFGLASLTEGIERDEVRAGTPGYMAPEQLAGEGVSVSSDIYALGLIFYELFTGKRAFEAHTPEEMKQLQDESTPVHPSDHVKGLDSGVECVILRCLEKDPAIRPASALTVAGALPGGDPLAAALAAGETPSPEMVAAGGGKGGLQRRHALAWLVATLTGLAVVALLGGTALYGRIPFEKSRDALEENARRILRDLGYVEPFADRGSQFWLSSRPFFYVLRKGEEDSYVDIDPMSVRAVFAYRQSPRLLVPIGLDGSVTCDDPPMRRPGDTCLLLDLEGRLLQYVRVPPAAGFSGQPPPPADWSALFRAADLDIESFESVPPTRHAEVFADRRAAWDGKVHRWADLPVRIEAASCGGDPVYFEFVFPWNDHWSEDTIGKGETAESAAKILTALLLLMIGLGVVVLALRNLMLARGNKRDAVRLGVFVGSLRLIHWMFTGHHVASMDELTLINKAAIGALGLAFAAWVLHMALEPYIRRTWPESIVSWSRLLAGRLRDPLVGHHLLVGLAIGVGFEVFLRLAGWWGSVSWGVPPPSLADWEYTVLGGRFVLGKLFSVQLASLAMAFLHLALFLLCRIIFRKTWLAAVVFCATIGTRFAAVFLDQSGGVHPRAALMLGTIVGIVTSAAIAFVLVRFGFLAAITKVTAAFFIESYPVTFDSNSPFFGIGLFGLLVVVLFTVSSYRISLVGQPALRR